jgi:hypothetical protein
MRTDDDYGTDSNPTGSSIASRRDREGQLSELWWLSLQVPQTTAGLEDFDPEILDYFDE